MWRGCGFPPRWETLAGDEGGEEEVEEDGGEEEEEEESRNYATTPSLLPSLWAEMMYGCKGHMLAV